MSQNSKAARRGKQQDKREERKRRLRRAERNAADAERLDQEYLRRMREELDD